ncbi:DegV family protein [Arthrobacter sp. zg-Y179]|uniref:DegV family protein n=1 Tax=Arthrobacter sp. zg-Y179 TaxID=2894188 RepID=UPI001E452B4F|nr:DegV family protein [Arthrobacter sp. zg-Y179]MCC9174568.1 DegV family protein [Arthrobacter sp. zg-Y179]
MDWLERLASRARGRQRETAAVPGPSVGVVTDSASALPGGWAEAANAADFVRVVPMPVMIGDQIYGEGSAELIPALALAMAQGHEVRTSRPAPGQFEAAYRELAAAGCTSVVSVHLSGQLSGTVDSARLAARSAEVPVEVIDSATAAMGLGFAVAAATESARAGSSASEVAADARSVAADATILFYVPSLDQLRRGGRIGAAAGWLGTLLAVKPILVVRDGMVVPLERVRTAPKALARLAELVQQDIAGRDGKVRAAVHHFGNASEAERLAGIVGAAAPEVEILICPLPAVLAAHAGLGVLAVAVAGDRSDPAGQTVQGAGAAGAGVPADGVATDDEGGRTDTGNAAGKPAASSAASRTRSAGTKAKGSKSSGGAKEQGARRS